MYHFEVSLFAKLKTFKLAAEVSLRGQALPTLDPAALLSGTPYTCSFEEASESLAQLLRMDIEPDGYFVCAGECDGKRWQIDGHLFDRADRLWRVDLKGSCPVEMFDNLLACFRWPATELVFQLVQEGVTLEEPVFRRWASAYQSATNAGTS